MPNRESLQTWAFSAKSARGRKESCAPGRASRSALRSALPSALPNPPRKRCCQNSPTRKPPSGSTSGATSGSTYASIRNHRHPACAGRHSRPQSPRPATQPAARPAARPAAGLAAGGAESGAWISRITRQRGRNLLQRGLAHLSAYADVPVGSQPQNMSPEAIIDIDLVRRPARRTCRPGQFRAVASPCRYRGYVLLRARIGRQTKLAQPPHLAGGFISTHWQPPVRLAWSAR